MSEQECCCPSLDGIVCVAIRYNLEIEDVDEPCDCFCHFLTIRRSDEDDFYFDVGDDDLDDYNDDGNRHNEMWESPETAIRGQRTEEIDLVTVFGVKPDELGELHDINLHGHESREEAYRKRFGL